MSTSNFEPQDTDESHALDGESPPEQVPEEWLGHDEPVARGETRYYATLYTVERELADADVLAGDREGRGETITLHVLYVRGDGRRRVERSYPTRAVETSDGLGVRPRGSVASSIAVDGSDVTPSSARQTDAVVDALTSLHDCTVHSTGGGQ